MHQSPDYRSSKVEHFIIKVMILGGIVASAGTTLLQLLAIKHVDISITVGFVATGFLLCFYLLTRFNHVILAGILTTSFLLLLMSTEVVMAQYLRQTSVATLIILAFSNSAAYSGTRRMILHAVTFLTLTSWIFFLNQVGYVLEDQSSVVGLGINLLGTYALLGYITYVLKRKFDKSMVGMEQLYFEMRDKESHLIQAEKMAALGTLSAGAAHELNNPLNFMLGGLEVLDKNMEGNDVDENIREPLSVVKEGAHRIKSIVKSLLDFSYSPVEDFYPVNTKEIVDNCLTLVNYKAQPNIDISTRFEMPSSHVKGNPGALHQVFINIILNGIQSIEKEGQITIEQSINSHSEIIKFTDTGCGISKANLSKVMDPFFTTKPPGEGTGLGLSVTYSIINNHGGSIEFQSEEKVGTQVIIRLPLFKQPD